MIVDPDFTDHWKTQLVARELGADAPLGMIRLWGHCQNRRDDTFALTAGQLAAITRIAADPAKAERVLIEARYIERQGAKITVLGWRERNQKLFANIKNGALGGRPKKNPTETQPKPMGNPSVTHGKPNGNPLETDKRRGEEIEAPHPAHACAPACARESDFSPAEAMSETWSFILTVLGAKKRRAGGEAEHALARQAEHLPLLAEQREVLAWFYGLPADERDVDLRARYRDADRLAINLFTALERAEHFAARNGGPTKKSGPEKKTAAEPEGWRRAMAIEFPEADLPETWEEFLTLGPSVRTRVEERLRHEQEGGEAAA